VDDIVVLYLMIGYWWFLFTFDENAAGRCLLRTLLWPIVAVRAVAFEAVRIVRHG
jgi:hypothetical protein